MGIESSTLLLIVRILFLLILSFTSSILWKSLRKERKLIVKKKKVAYTEKPNIEKNIIIQAKARPGHFFTHEDIITVCNDLDLKLSSDHIFNYYLDEKQGDGLQIIPFSIINSRNNGRFDLENPKSYVDSLIAVMRLPVADGYNQEKYFHIMLSALEAMRLRLKATLADENGSNIRNNKLYEIQREIKDFEDSYQSEINRKYKLNK